MLTFRTLGFKPYWLQELTKFGPSFFPIQLLWGFTFPQAPLDPSLWLWPALHCSSHDPFLSQIDLCTSFFLLGGLYTPLRRRVYPVSLHVDFWVFRVIWELSSCTCGTSWAYGPPTLLPSSTLVSNMCIFNFTRQCQFIFQRFSHDLW